ncbi:MAG: hypothetical protein SynsKO_35110 [Synoicihabitans sp.]
MSSVPPQTAPEALIADYFERLLEAFEQAANASGGALAFDASVANRQLAVRYSGAGLGRVFTPALAHLGESPASALCGPALRIYCWETELSGVPLPPPPWHWPDSGEAQQHVVLPASAQRFRLHVTREYEELTLYDTATLRAVVWARDANKLPAYYHAAPFLKVFGWWGDGEGLHLVHAACVGEAGTGLLLAGRGGSGKSTTSLLGLMAGMQFVSDDYCLLESPATTAPTAHCLFSSGKLLRSHLENFPRLARVAVSPPEDGFDKKVIYAHEHFPDQVSPRLRIGAIVLPRVAHLEQCAVTPASFADALKALAPSTLFQLRATDSRSFRAMAALTRKVPCRHLELGRDFAEIPHCLRSILTSLLKESQL